MSAARKLKAVEATLPPLRRPLADALARVEELKAEIASNEEAKDKARAAIRAAEKAIEDAEEKLASAPALERKPYRAALAEAKEDLADLQDHLEELKKRNGEPPYSEFGSLPGKLRDAENTAQNERAALLKSHPSTHATLRRLAELRAEQNQVIANLLLLEKASAIPESGRSWQSVPLVAPPAPDAALSRWIEELLTDAAAELEAE